MSKSIYSIQRTLNEILDIAPEEYTIPDAELFDCSDYVNNGKVWPWIPFDRTGIKTTEETKELMRGPRPSMNGNKNGIGNKGRKGRGLTAEHKMKISLQKTGRKESEEIKKSRSIAMKEYWRLKKLNK